MFYIDIELYSHSSLLKLIYAREFKENFEVLNENLKILNCIKNMWY